MEDKVFARREPGRLEDKGDGITDSRAMCEDTGPPPITSQRRRELLKFAVELADQVERATKPHERCLLRRMTESLLGDCY